MFGANLHNEKTAEQLLGEARSPQDAYKNAIRRDKELNIVEPWKRFPSGRQQQLKLNKNQWVLSNLDVGAYNLTIKTIQNKEETKKDDEITAMEQRIRDNKIPITHNKNKVTFAAINLAQIIYKHARQKIKFVRSAQNGDILLKCGSTNFSYLHKWNEEQPEKERNTS